MFANAGRLLAIAVSEPRFQEFYNVLGAGHEQSMIFRRAVIIMTPVSKGSIAV